MITPSPGAASPSWGIIFIWGMISLWDNLSWEALCSFWVVSVPCHQDGYQLGPRTQGNNGQSDPGGKSIKESKNRGREVQNGVC
jgi:hypothetical protein